MALTDSLRILITANGAQAEREFTKVGAAAKKNLGAAETSAQKMGRSLTSAGVAMATFGGVALVGLYKAAQAADQENLAIEKLNTAFSNSPTLVGESTDALLAQAGALQDTTVYADDATINMQAMLATFRLTSDEITNLTPLVQDLASFWGVDLESAAKQVGKAMQGNVGALQRNGVMIDEAAYATDRYSAIVAALRENAGGFAATEGQSFNGQLMIMKNNLGDIAEGLGQGVLQAFNGLLGPVKAVSAAFEKLSPEAQGTVGKLMTFGAAGLVAAGALSFVAGQAALAAERFGKLRAASIAAQGGLYGLAAVIGYELGRAWAEFDANRGINIVLDDLQAVATGTTAELNELATTMVGLGTDSDDVTGLFSDLLTLGPAGASAVTRLSDAFVAAGFPAEEMAEILWDLRGAAYTASGGLDAVEESTRGAGTAARELADEWGGLGDRLNDFNATLGAQEALMGLRDSLAAAREEGGITADEMVGLNGDLSGLVESYMRLAEEQATAADGSVNFQQRNRLLRESLGALAAFIPAELRPQFRQLTQDVLEVPDNSNTNVRQTGAQAVREAIAEVERVANLLDGKRVTVYLDAEMSAAVGDFLRGPGAELTGGGSGRMGPRLTPITRRPGQGPGGPGTSGGSGGFPTADEIGRAVASEMGKRPLMTVGVN